MKSAQLIKSGDHLRFTFVHYFWTTDHFHGKTIWQQSREILSDRISFLLDIFVMSFILMRKTLLASTFVIHWTMLSDGPHWMWHTTTLAPPPPATMSATLRFHNSAGNAREHACLWWLNWSLNTMWQHATIIANTEWSRCHHLYCPDTFIVLVEHLRTYLLIKFKPNTEKLIPHVWSKCF